MAKAQHDAVTGNACLHQFRGDSLLRAVVLYPDFVSLDVYMEETAMHTPLPIPTVPDQFVVSLLVVKNHLGFDVTVRRFERGVFPKDPLDDLAGVYWGIHRKIVSFTGSKTMRRKSSAGIRS